MNNIKYLGVYIDSRIKFNIPANIIYQNVIERNNMLKVLMNRKLGCHPQTALTIFKAIVQGYINYGLTLTANASKTQW